MKARALINGASKSFDPEALKLIRQAFDEAWAEIAKDHPKLPAQNARLHLATIVMSLVARDNDWDVEMLKGAAIFRFKRDWLTEPWRDRK